MIKEISGTVSFEANKNFLQDYSLIYSTLISELDSRSPPSRGQVYPCESRGGDDSFRTDMKRSWRRYTGNYVLIKSLV